MFTVGPDGDSKSAKRSDALLTEGFFKYASPCYSCSIVMLTLQKSLEIITGKITDAPTTTKTLPRPRTAFPIYKRAEAIDKKASIYTTSSAAIGNNGRPVSAVMRNAENFGVSEESAELLS